MGRVYLKLGEEGGFKGVNEKKVEGVMDEMGVKGVG